MLAFKPEFIRTLWYTLLTSKSQKNQLSISILSRGIPIRRFEAFPSKVFTNQSHFSTIGK